jgi:hypothetical protein
LLVLKGKLIPSTKAHSKGEEREQEGITQAELSRQSSEAEGTEAFLANITVAGD